MTSDCDQIINLFCIFNENHFKNLMINKLKKKIIIILRDFSEFSIFDVFHELPYDNV